MYEPGPAPSPSVLLESTTSQDAIKPNLLDKIGGRKFFLTMTIVILSFTALGFKWIDATVFQYICYLIVITYVGGNVAQKIGLNIVEKPKETVTTSN
jgi:hypothetical protein